MNHPLGFPANSDRETILIAFFFRFPACLRRFLAVAATVAYNVEKDPTMLIEFRVHNYRSLREEQALTLECGRIGSADDGRPRTVSGNQTPLLPVAVLYGANASGKSNVLSALAFMREAVCDSYRYWSPDEEIPRDPFAWGEARIEPSFFEATILISGTKFEYGFLASNEEFLEEWLYAWPNGKKQVWLERDKSTFKFGENLKGENKLIAEVTRPNALFLSTAVQNKHEQIQPVYAWFRDLQPINLGDTLRRSSVSSRSGGGMNEFAVARMLEEEAIESPQRSLFPKSLSLSQRFRDLLKNADIGIVDVRVDKSDSENGRKYRSNRFLMKHDCSTDDAWLPLEEESRGTRTLFRIALPILYAMQFGGTLIIDELEASLHPTLAQHIVRQFNEPESNPNNAQLIFTTHDTNLLGTTLGEPALRRDQVWLTEKDKEGATVVYPLTDYQPRNNENLERGYLQGRYGAIPFLGNFSFIEGLMPHEQSTTEP